MGCHTLGYLASALKSNTGLRRLTLWDRTNKGGFAAFAGVLAANACLEELRFTGGPFLDSDLRALAEGLRQNHTLKLLALPRVGSTPLGLRPLIEVVRYHNRALEELIVPFDLSSAQLLITAACRFHCAFHAACQAHHRVCGGFAAAAAATGHSSNAESALRQF